MLTQRDVKNRISSVKNIEKITRAMEMVAAARLRRAEQRIAALRPYAGAIRRMTRQAAEAAGAEASSLPLLREHEQQQTVALLLVTGDRGLAGAFNSQIIRAGTRAGAEHESNGQRLAWYASGRRGVSSLTFRGHEVTGAYTGFTDRPSYADARHIADDLMTAYIDGHVDSVEIFYNGYVSPLTQHVRRETLLPLARATVLESEEEEGREREAGDAERGQAAARGQGAEGSEQRALVDYEPGPEEILRRLIPDYVEISIFRALLESTASEHGARMTAMRNASENAGELIEDLTLEMNRARQAEITQEIMEVVAGAESLA
jgi:F-type H+-transporting ATPase subunit gamma